MIRSSSPRIECVMSEVSCRTFGPILSALETRGIPFSVLIDGLPVTEEELNSTESRVSWDSLIEITNRCEELLGGVENLEEIYFEHFTTPRAGMVPSVTKLLVNPRDIYWAGTSWFGPSLFSVIEGEFEELPDGRIRETLVIPDRYGDCPQIFPMIRGGLRAAPSILGLTAAEVELQASTRKAIFTITPPKSRRGLLSYFVEMMTRRRGIGVVKALASQQTQVQQSFKRLGEAHDRIAAQAKRLEVVNSALLNKNDELETRVLERTAKLEATNRVLASEVEERRRTASDLAHSREQLRIVERLASVGTLAAGIAHEINNPVAAIMLASQYALTCQDQPDAEEIAQRSLLDIEREAKRCGTIVKSVLQFARDEPTTKWVVNINDVKSRAVLNTRPLALASGVDVEDVDCGKSLHCLMNPLQIEQALVNLLRNAIESSNHGVSVRISLEERDGRAVVCVQDKGSGIGDAIRGRVFDPFFTTRRWKGQVGLGLSVAHGIVSEHAGTIEIESKVGSGSRVWIELETSEPTPAVSNP
ncbi:MAG: signal transduction histidine kinase [Myxococcota bacterium]